MVLTVIFWILWLLCLIGAFAPDNVPYVNGGRWVVVLLLIGCLGLKVLGNPIDK